MSKDKLLLAFSQLLLLVWLAAGGVRALWTSFQVNLTAIQAIQSIISQPIVVPQSLFKQPMGAEVANARSRRLLMIASAWQGTPADVAAVWASGDWAQVDVAPMTRIALAQAYFARGYEEDGRRMLQQIPGAWTWAYTGGLALKYQRKWQDALLWFERALPADASISEQRLDLCLETCRARGSVGDFPGAVEACLWAIQVAPPGSEAYTLTGNMYLHSGKPQAAYEILMAGLTPRPAHPVWHYVELGRAAKALGDMVSARAWYERALALDPTDLSANSYLGILLADMGQNQEAIHYLEIVIANSEDGTWGEARNALERIR